MGSKAGVQPSLAPVSVLADGTCVGADRIRCSLEGGGCPEKAGAAEPQRLHFRIRSVI